MATGIKSKPGDPLTARQEEMRELIRSWTREHGYGPSLRDLGAAMGIALNAVQQLVIALERKGAIVRRKGLSRSITLVGEEGVDRESLRAALRMVLDRLMPVPSAEPGEGTIGYSAYFSRAECDHLKALAGEGGS